MKINARISDQKKIAISHMAVRETSAFRQHGRPIEDPLNYLCPPLRSTFAVRETASLGQQMLNATVGINGLIRPSLRRETLVSRSADVRLSSLI